MFMESLNKPQMKYQVVNAIYVTIKFLYNFTPKEKVQSNTKKFPIYLYPNWLLPNI